MSDAEDGVMIDPPTRKDSGSDSSGVLIETPAPAPSPSPPRSSSRASSRRGGRSPRSGSSRSRSRSKSRSPSKRRQGSFLDPGTGAASSAPLTARGADGAVRLFAGGYRTSFGPSDPSRGVWGLHYPPLKGDPTGKKAGIAPLGGREDCCAYVCCGAFLSGRTKHQLKYALRAHRRDGYTTIDTSVLADEIESADRRRKAVYFAVFVAFVAGLIVCIWTVPMDQSAYKDKQADAADDDRYEGTFGEYQLEVLTKSMGTVLSLYALVTGVVCIRGRMATRRAIEAIIPTTKDPDVSEEEHLAMLNSNTTAVCAHGPCGCYPVDYSPEAVVPYSSAPEGYVGMETMQRDGGLEARIREDDYCSSCVRGWVGWLSGFFCITSHWVQCCGICAVAQEAREVRNLVPEEMQYIDFLTFEPYTSYQNKHAELQKRNEGSIASHVRASSVLSKYILYGNIFVMSMIFFIAIAVDNAEIKSANVIGICATALQAWIVLLFDHWVWRRFDCSLDAVIKMFAVGFYLCAPLVMMAQYSIEKFFSTAFSLCFAQAQVQMEYYDIVLDLENYVYWGFPVTMFTKLAAAFFHSFFIVALLQELVKYMCFYMIQHPCLMPDDRRTLESRSAAITVAMVASAVGFAVFEDFAFIFRDPSTVSLYGYVLLSLKYFLPIHPLCAALQSVGVCRRDIEAEHGFSTGWIIYPAVVLHGLYNFMFASLAIVADNFADSAAEAINIDADTVDDFEDLIKLAGGVVGVGIFFIGLICFAVSSHAQKARIEKIALKKHDQEGPYNLA